jgi:hypothetical protein
MVSKEELGFNELLDPWSDKDSLKFAIDYGRFLASSTVSMSKTQVYAHALTIVATTELNAEMEKMFCNRVWYGYMLQVNFCK